LFALREAFSWRADWIYASDLFSCPAALGLTYVTRSRIVYHEHDSPNVSRPNSLVRFLLWTRIRLARRASLCVAPNVARAEEFQRQTGRTAICVWNCPSRKEVSPARNSPGGDVFRIYFHGTINSEMFPASILVALSRLPERVKLRVVGYETLASRGCTRGLQAMADELNIGARVELIGATPRDKILKLCAECDVGIACVPPQQSNINLANLVGASNKAFDYQACGLALLVSDLPQWRESYVAPGFGLACNPADPDSIVASLNWFLEHREETRAMGERGRQKILTEWNYENQFQPVLERMTQGNPCPAYC
jgi:glycosyltransferase involved in cell wall biosynthesis